MGEYRKHRGSFLISKSINPQIISHFSTSSTLYIIHSQLIYVYPYKFTQNQTVYFCRIASGFLIIINNQGTDTLQCGLSCGLSPIKCLSILDSNSLDINEFFFFHVNNFQLKLKEFVRSFYGNLNIDMPERFTQIIDCSQPQGCNDGIHIAMRRHNDDFNCRVVDFYFF